MYSIVLYVWLVAQEVCRLNAEPLVVNGVNGATGGYLLPKLTPQQIAQIARGESWDPQHLMELKWWHQRTTQATFGPIEGVDPKDLAGRVDRRCDGERGFVEHDGAPSRLSELVQRSREPATRGVAHPAHTAAKGDE